MKTIFKAHLILGMILFASLFGFSATPPLTVNAVYTTFAVAQAFWGTTLNRTIEVYPGDQNVPLTVVVQNIGTYPNNYTINGIRAGLWLPGPNFTAVDGTSHALAYYSSSTGVPPGGSFSLTFRVNINASASPGTYSLGVNLKYLVQGGPPPAFSDWRDGDDRSLTVVVFLMGKCALAVTTTGNSITAGSSNTLNINILNNGNATTPVLDVSLSLPAPLILSGDNYWHFTNLAPNESAEIPASVYVPPLVSVGTTYQATLSLAYQTPYGSIRTETHLIGLRVSEAVQPVRMAVSIVGDELTAGSMNDLYFAVKNSGSTLVSVLDVYLSLPSPLVLSGDNHWHFINLSSDGSAEMKASVYVPPLVSVGTTYQATLSLSYQTPYGDVRTESHLIGLRVSEAVQPLRMAVSIVGGELTAGAVNNLYFTVRNNGSAPVTVLDVSLSLPSPLVLSGDSRWHFTDISPNALVRIDVSAYVPIAAAGTTYQATLSLSYQTSYGDAYTETHSVGLIVLGVVYPELIVSISESELAGGYMDTVSFTITNNGSIPVSTLDSVLTLPSPLLIVGDNRWRFTEIPAKGTVSIDLKIFSPTASIGNAYQGTLALTYQDRYGNSKTESHAIGFYVRGLIQLVVYSVAASPTVAVAGSSVTITANLLNKGNIAAMYTNVSVARQDPWVVGSESVAYIGQVDPNSPAPFSITAYINAAAQNGTYPLSLLISSQDERYVIHSFTSTIQIEVTSGVPIGPQRPAPSTLELIWGRWGYYILAAVFVAIVLGLYYIRRRKKESGTSKV